LIRKHNKLAKAARAKAKVEQTMNIIGIPKNVLLVNGVFNDRMVRELIRTIDAKKYKST